ESLVSERSERDRLTRLPDREVLRIAASQIVCGRSERRTRRRRTRIHVVRVTHRQRLTQPTSTTHRRRTRRLRRTRIRKRTSATGHRRRRSSLPNREVLRIAASQIVCGRSERRTRRRRTRIHVVRVTHRQRLTQPTSTTHRRRTRRL